MEKILSIVIPSYNTEKYMDECLPFFFDKRIESKVEILIINDGSTDATSEKAESYRKRFPEMIRVINKENGGHGSVINRGIMEAEGKYFKVVDGDDWVITDNLVRLVGDLEKFDADLVVNPHIRHNVIHNENKEFRCSVKDYRRRMKFEELSVDTSWMSIHMITYRTNLLKKNNIRVQEHCFYEDAEYCLYPIEVIKDVVLLDYPVCVYRVGTPTQSISRESIIRNRSMLETITYNMIQYDNQLTTDISNAKKTTVAKFICTKISLVYGAYLRMGFNKDAKTAIHDFDERVCRMSPKLYRESENLPLKLLRTKTWFGYGIVYLAFCIKHLLRGY